MTVIETTLPDGATVPDAPEPTRPDGAPTPPDLLARWSLAGLLLATAVLYLWGLSASGWANSFYSAAAQAGSTNWTAFFFGSLDGGNSITVDKPPASIWLMALSVRLFGLNSWSILVPEALLGVASVGVVYATVRRTLRGWRPAAGQTHPLTERGAHWAALAGAATFALTPAAVLMFRFNNPDALLVFTMVVAAYGTVRAVETASRRWLVLAGVAIGFGFLTKMLQAFLVLPALAVAYAIAAPATWRKRIADLLAAFAAMVVSFGWYLAVVELTPASLRPYIGGSQTNSLLELIISYNGLGRITGSEVGSVGAGNGGMWGSTGITRMFDGVSGGMISWLIPAALVLGVAAIAVTAILGRRLVPAQLSTAARTASPRAALTAGLTIWLGWLVITALVFSFMAGIYHDYYTVALAPAIGAAVALGGAVLWAHRGNLAARSVLAATSAGTGVWALVLLLRAGGWYTALGWGAALLGGAAGAALLVVDRLPRTLAATALGAALVAGLAGPTAYAVNTAATPHTGSIVTAGPVSGTGRGGAGDGRGGQGFGRGAPPAGMAPPTAGQAPGTGTAPTGTTQTGGTTTGQGPTGTDGVGGLLNGASVSSELTALLTDNAEHYTWVAAAIGSQNAASYQLATGDPVMAIGGFNGSDPSPTLDEFKALATAGRIHYFLGGDLGGRQNGGSAAAGEIAAWVADTYTATTVGGTTVYDLTQN